MELLMADDEGLMADYQLADMATVKDMFVATFGDEHAAADAPLPLAPSHAGTEPPTASPLMPPAPPPSPMGASRQATGESSGGASAGPAPPEASRHPSREARPQKPGLPVMGVLVSTSPRVHLFICAWRPRERLPPLAGAPAEDRRAAAPRRARCGGGDAAGARAAAAAAGMAPAARVAPPPPSPHPAGGWRRSCAPRCSARARPPPPSGRRGPHTPLGGRSSPPAPQSLGHTSDDRPRWPLPKCGPGPPS